MNLTVYAIDSMVRQRIAELERQARGPGRRRPLRSPHARRTPRPVWRHANRGAVPAARERRAGRS